MCSLGSAGIKKPRTFLHSGQAESRPEEDGWRIENPKTSGFRGMLQQAVFQAAAALAASQSNTKMIRRISL
jgi:hypothetical protein